MYKYGERKKAKLLEVKKLSDFVYMIKCEYGYPMFPVSMKEVIEALVSEGLDVEEIKKKYSIHLGKDNTFKYNLSRIFKDIYYLGYLYAKGKQSFKRGAEVNQVFINYDYEGGNYFTNHIVSVDKFVGNNRIVIKDYEDSKQLALIQYIADHDKGAELTVLLEQGVKLKDILGEDRLEYLESIGASEYRGIDSTNVGRLLISALVREKILEEQEKGNEIESINLKIDMKRLRAFSFNDITFNIKTKGKY